MQTITVKVCYKGKTLIVGKGIGSVEQITKELAKRFPQVEQIKSSLTVGYENEAQDLLSAYKIAEKENRKFIKVKFNSEDRFDRSFISERPEDSCMISVLDPSEEKDKVAQFMKPKQAEKENAQKIQPKSEGFQNLEERSDIAVESPVIQIPIEIKESSSQQTLLIEPQRNEQTNEEPKPEGQVSENLGKKLSQIKNTQEKMDNPIDYGLLDDYFPPKKEEVSTHEAKDKKRNNFNSLFGYTEKKPEKKEEPALNPDAQAILEIIKKQYDSKISTLQFQYADLKIKYNNLSSKYDHLSAVCGIKNEVKTELKPNQIEAQHKKKCAQQINKLENWFYNIQKDAESEHKPDSKLKNTQPVEYFAQISQFSTIQYAHIGETVQSTFRIKNVGLKKWPENVFAQEQNSQELIDIKSLEPSQSAIVTLHTENAKKLGEKINKMYQLVYFDEKNQVRKFGRIFGISVEVIPENKIIDLVFDKPKPNDSKKNYGKFSDPIIIFRQYINEIMKKNKLASKSLFDVIACLKDFDITSQTYKNCDTKTLAQFIKSICL